MTLRYAPVAGGLLLLLQTSWLVAQEENAPRNPNSRLRKSGEQSGSNQKQAAKPLYAQQNGNRVSASASASASGFGFGNGNGFGGGYNPGMGYGQAYGNPMQFNRGMGYGNGMGFGNARARASVTVSGDEPKTSRPASGSASKSQASNKSSASAKKNRTASYVDGDRMISVTESKNKIKVTISNESTDDEKTYSARNAAELEKKFPEGYEAYKLATENADEEMTDNKKDSGNDAASEANAMLEEQLKKFEAENAGNPLMRQMLEQMRRDMGR